MPSFSPLKMPGALSLMPSPIVTMPQMLTVSNSPRIASHAAKSADSLSPLPIHLYALSAAGLGGADELQPDQAFQVDGSNRRQVAGRLCGAPFRLRRHVSLLPKFGRAAHAFWRKGKYHCIFASVQREKPAPRTRGTAQQPVPSPGMHVDRPPPCDISDVQRASVDGETKVGPSTSSGFPDRSPPSRCRAAAPATSRRNSST